MLVTGSYDTTIVVWDVENEMQKVKLQVIHLLHSLDKFSK